MATTGEIVFTQASTTNESPHLDEPWINPANALVDDGTPASVTATTFDAGDQTAILRTYNASTALAAAIPADAQSIDGVIVRVNAWSDGATGRQIDLIQLLSATGALSGTNLAGPTTVGTNQASVYTFGSSTEKWGLGAGLTRALLIDVDFGVGLGFITANANSEAYVDVVTIEVFYTPAGQALTETPADSVALTDSASTAKTIPSSQADSIALTDARAHAVGKGVADTLTGVDSFSRAVETARSVLDDVLLSDVVVKATGLVRDDPIVLSDLASPVKSREQQIDDTLALADELSRAAQFVRTLADPLVLADAVFDSQALSVGDALALADQLTRASDDARSLADELALLDLFERVSETQRAIADPIALSDLADPLHVPATDEMVTLTINLTL